MAENLRTPRLSSKKLSLIKKKVYLKRKKMYETISLLSQSSRLLIRFILALIKSYITGNSSVSLNPSIRFCILTFIHSFVRSFIRSFIHSFVHSFIHSFIHSCMHSFIHSFIQAHDLADLLKRTRTQYLSEKRYTSQTSQ